MIGIAARVAATAAVGVVGLGAWVYQDKAPAGIPFPFVTLSSYQAHCSQAIATLVSAIPYIEPEDGYRVRLGEAHRTAEQAAFNAMSGKGIENSLHRDRLAVDLMIDKKIGGVWVYQNGAQGTTEPYIKACKVWKYIGNKSTPAFPATCGAEWGDYVHFSCAYSGRK
jgi:hypothetical protein